MLNKSSWWVMGFCVLNGLAAIAQEPSLVSPGVTLISERAIPVPYGISPEIVRAFTISAISGEIP